MKRVEEPTDVKNELEVTQNIYREDLKPTVETVLQVLIKRCENLAKRTEIEFSNK